jgi:hypothetical protein
MLPQCFKILALKSGFSNVVMLQAVAAPGSAIKACACDSLSSVELLLVTFIFILIELVHWHPPKGMRVTDTDDPRRVTDWSRHKEFRRSIEAAMSDGARHHSDKG